jgi:hypothetical protein
VGNYECEAGGGVSREVGDEVTTPEGLLIAAALVDKARGECFTVVRDDGRYNHGAVIGVNTTRLCGGEWPERFQVIGMTRDQVESLCNLLDYSHDAGLDGLFSIEEPEGSNAPTL